MTNNTTRTSLIDLLRDVQLEDDVIAYDFLVSEASALEIERRIRNQIIEELAGEAESFPEELYVFDHEWNLHEINAGQDVAAWLRSKKTDTP